MEFADYTRFSRDKRSAFAGSAIGYLIPNAWLYALGAVLVLTNPAYSNPDATELMTSIAAGGLAAGLALLALTVDETDEAFANVYSTAVSLQNALPRAPQRLLIGLAATGATVGALVITWAEYETFLFMLGSFFVPLFGVLLAAWLLAGRLCPLPMAAPHRAEQLDGSRGEDRSGRHRCVTAELRVVVRPRIRLRA